MSWGTIVYRCAVLALLGAIVLQLGGWDFLEKSYRDVRWHMTNRDKPIEEPSPRRTDQSSGLDAVHQEGTDRVLDDLARRSNATK